MEESVPIASIFNDSPLVLSTEIIFWTVAQQSEIVKQTVQTEKNAKAQLEDIQQKMMVMSRTLMTQ